MSLKACHCCGQVHRLARESDSTVAYACTRCGSTIADGARSKWSSQRTAAAAMAALFLFPAAIFLPILEIEKLGHRYHSSIVGGIFELYAQGSWFIATIIFAFSIVLPILKLVTLLELCWFRWLEHHHRATAYRIIEFSGRWSMLDVMLLAFLVMLIKLSGIVEFQVGPAVVAFAGCVGMSIIASMLFDPHSIWER